jgi:hypothetical protein
MPKVASSLREKMHSYVKEFGADVLSSDGSVLICKICAKPISAEKKFAVTQHIAGAKHKEKVKSKETPQAQLAPLLSLSKKESDFSMDLCRMFVESGIPLAKVSHPAVRSFLEKHTKQDVPDESTLRKTYLPKVYNEHILRIREAIGDSPVWVQVDETTDSVGRYVGNVLVGAMDSAKPTNAFLLHCEELDRTNSTTIAQLFTKAFSVLWPQEIHHDRVLLFLSDAAAYMKKAARALKVIFPKMVHLTCVVHAVHRVCEEVRALFPEVDSLVANGKRVFLKAPSRIHTLKEISPGLPLPPQPVLTRWATWLEAALYYAGNYEEIKKVFNALDPEEAASIRSVQCTINKASVKHDLAFLSTHLSRLPSLITSMEGSGRPLSESLDLLNEVTHIVEGITGERGMKIFAKWDAVIAANSDLQIVTKISAILKGEAVDEPLPHNPRELAAFQYAPVTSVDVERSFSILKYVLADRRRKFTFANLRHHLIPMSNAFFANCVE